MGAVAIGAMAVGSAVKGYGEAKSARAESKYYSYLSSTATENARLAREAGAEEVRQVGAQQYQAVGQIGTAKRELQGAQRAALVSGAGVGSKTAEQIASDTETKSQLDEMALRYNADLKMKNIRTSSEATAKNYEAEAAADRAAARNAKRTAGLGIASSILGTASSTAFGVKAWNK